jgi:5-methylcytosine-specific restriction endonuclease McrA
MTRRWCSRPGCREFAVARSSWCEGHASARVRDEGAYDAARGTAARRGYDAEWRKVRDGVLEARPRCVRCGGKAVLVHHVVPIREGGDRLDPANMEPLCGRCHNREHHGRRRGGGDPLFGGGRDRVGECSVGEGEQSKGGAR